MKAAILGGSGYVAGELLRLLAFHPEFQVAMVASRALVNTPIREQFPHLSPSYPNLTFSDPASVFTLASEESLSVFAALPHGESAKVIAALLDRAHPLTRIVDLSADFRFSEQHMYEQIYSKEHGAPHLLSRFHCGLPDLPDTLIEAGEETAQHRAHPGCFTTAVTMAIAPMHQSLDVDPHYRVSAITGSTGSGKEPSRTTHHPERRSNLKAYAPLLHRHRAEMETLLQQLQGRSAQVAFVPHSGPFSRGIHATIHAQSKTDLDVQDFLEVYREFYRHSPFVQVEATPPSLSSVIGTNVIRLGVSVHRNDIVIMSVIDNLTKGAAGGAIHWMNRLRDLPQSTGLTLPGLGWI